MAGKREMKIDAPKSGLAVGLNKGHITTPIPLVKSVRPSRRKGLKTNSNTLVSEVIREVCGFAPYERHMIELIKTGSSSAQKRALKFAKKRLGTLRRAKAKNEEMIRVVELQRKRKA
ncbi:60S ribosomal protein L36 [Babesia sp. Xinjiang]|uniref:60S ribosomal protein L36 n=1 Tax=Babesia sp. Xinjiang TaxID=462227 RepID=UPI000A23FDE2|nr:60S ribosomal protein L36 [Babesia sp. Xinjiang]ORM40725.1 60S ribosomal protein L36 [Babesia sp. Xinjiang]